MIPDKMNYFPFKENRVLSHTVYDEETHSKARMITQRLEMVRTDLNTLR